MYSNTAMHQLATIYREKHITTDVDEAIRRIFVKLHHLDSKDFVTNKLSKKRTAKTQLTKQSIVISSLTVSERLADYKDQLSYVFSCRKIKMHDKFHKLEVC